MASGGSDRNAEDALSKLLQRGTVVEYHNEFEMLINRVTGIYEGSLKALYISELKPALQCALLRSNPTTLGEAFFRARITDARFEDENNQAADNNVGDQEDPNVNDKQEVKKVKKLPMKLQSKKNFKEALETTSKDLKKKMLDHDLQKIAVDQKKKHYKTKRTLKIDDEEFKKAKSETTTKIRKLAKVYGAWLPPWLAAHFVVYQPYVKNHWKEFMIIQRRIWKPRIKIALEVASEAIRETTIAVDTVAKIEETGEFSTSESEEYGTKPKKRKGNYDGFKWCVQEASDFEELKQQLSTTSVLSLPDFNEVLVVEVDASANGIGAVLLQNSRPISYFSRKLGPRMSFAAAYQKEVVTELLEEFQERGEPMAICDSRVVFLKTAMQRRSWDPGIKSDFQDNTLRLRWFRRSGECYALSLGMFVCLTICLV
ncbi:myosin heavy chain-related protein [Tanacetum coccineum]